MPSSDKDDGKISEMAGTEIHYEQCSQCGTSLMKNMPKPFEIKYDPGGIAATQANVCLSMPCETPART